MYYTVGDTIGLYERNYTLLAQLVPGLEYMDGVHVMRVGTQHLLRVEVLERSVYSSNVALTYHVGGGAGWLNDIHLVVRLYHDARVAEVTGYQHQLYRRPWYGGQRAGGKHAGEKRQINLFLNECLNHCRREGCAVLSHGNVTLS